MLRSITEEDEKAVCRGTIKNIMQRTGSESWLGKNDGVQWKRGTDRYEPESLCSKEQWTRQQLPKTIRTVKNNWERLNGYWRGYYTKNKERSGKDLSKDKRKINMRWHFVEYWSFRLKVKHVVNSPSEFMFLSFFNKQYKLNITSLCSFLKQFNDITV